MNTTLTEKIQKLFQDEAFMAKMSEVAEIEDLKALFESYGVGLTDEELAEYVKAPLGDKANEMEEELDESSLDEVSGGGLVGASWKALKFTWKQSKKVWGGGKETVEGCAQFWGDVVSGKDPRKRW